MLRSWLLVAAVFVVSSSFATAGEIVYEPDVEFANPDNQHLKLNLARPKDGVGPFPAIVCIHGGGFRAGDRNGHTARVKKLAEQGYVAITVDYRLSPKYQYPAAIHDVKAAVRWLRANAAKYKINPDRIGAMGDSAGAHLAMFLGVTGGVKQFEGDGGNPEQSSRVQCVVEFYGPSDFTKSYGKSVDAHEVLPLFFGGGIETRYYYHVMGSPLNWVTPEAAPTLLVHGIEDKYVAYEQATWMYERLRSVEVDAKLFTLLKAGHGFAGTDAERAEAEMLAWFDKHLRPKR